MSAEEFKKAWKDDAAGALTSFIQGLGTAEEKGESAIVLLTEMGLSEVRLRDSLLRAANAGDLLNNAIKMGNEAFEENTALTEEASKRYATVESQLKTTRNKINNVAMSLGEKLLPTVNKMLGKADKWIEKLDKLSDEEKENIIKIGLLVAAIGPALKLGSSAITVIGGVSKGLGTFNKAIALAHNGIGTATGSAATLAKVFQGLTSPAGLAALGITAAVSAIVIAMEKTEKDTRKAFSNMGNSASEFINGINTAQSHLNAFNSELFVSSEEQQKLQEQMQEVQKGITDICKRASEERRDYTQEEITQLDEYFTKLRELNQREIEIQEQISNAISQQAVQNSNTFKGSLEEYKTQSQEWIKTAEEQKNKTVELINKQTIEEIALLNTRYNTEALQQTEAYQNEYAKITEQKESKIRAAEDEVGKINKAYADGYLERSQQNDGFYNKLQEFNEKQQKLEEAHKEQIEKIKNGELWYVTNKQQAILGENETFAFHQKEIWNEMYKNMSEEQENELGVWLAMVSQTEMYGGDINEETKNIVDTILATYDKMPDRTRETMKNAMAPMLEEMKAKEPVLFARADGIAGGILSRLRKSFDIHSPSRETRNIFQNVMKGAELGLEDEQKNLNRQIDLIAEQMKTNFSNIVPNMGAIKQSVIDQTRTVFTTPNIIINAQDELTPAKINTIIDTVNRRLGSQY